MHRFEALCSGLLKRIKMRVCNTLRTSGFLSSLWQPGLLLGEVSYSPRVAIRLQQLFMKRMWYITWLWVPPSKVAVRGISAPVGKCQLA